MLWEAIILWPVTIHGITKQWNFVLKRLGTAFSMYCKVKGPTRIIAVCLNIIMYVIVVNTQMLLRRMRNMTQKAVCLCRSWLMLLYGSDRKRTLVEMR